jgi:hypothetical protein
MIIYHSRFLTRGEVWFDNAVGPEPVDWLVYHQRSAPLPRGHWRSFYTLAIDLRPEPAAIMAQMDGFTAADVRRAEKKDHTICRKLDPSAHATLDAFVDFYDRFAAQANLGGADRTWLGRTAQAGALDIWAADDPEGQRLAYHVLYRGPKRVRSFHSVSFHRDACSKEARRAIGRANRLLVWTCMLHYREAGAPLFDMGGWYNGTSDAALLGINRFKQGFGGKILCEYQGEVVVSLKARVVMALARLLRKGKDRKSAAAAESDRQVQLEPA